MSAPFIIPFNQQPDSSNFFITGSYTIPAGKYARVTADCVQGGIFSINSNQVIITENPLTYSLNNVVSGTVTTFGAGYIYEVSFGAHATNGSGILNNAAVIPIVTTDLSKVYKLGPGSTFTSTVNYDVVGIGIPLRNLNVRDYYWVKTGDILTITNTCRVHVELYNMIS